MTVGKDHIMYGMEHSPHQFSSLIKTDPEHKAKTGVFTIWANDILTLIPEQWLSSTSIQNERMLVETIS